MLNQKFLEYVDDVISRLSAPEKFKVKLENELIRHIIETSENTNIDEVIKKLGSPEELADEMSRKLANGISKELCSNLMEFDKENMKPREMPDKSCKKPDPNQNHDRNMNPIYIGEYMREESDVNIKLLHIPLIQICSGVQRIRVPLLDEYYLD